MSSYKKALDSFASQLSKGLQQYEKDFLKAPRHEQLVVDSVSTAMVNVKMCLDQTLKSVCDRSDQMQRDVIEPLELYFKHYALSNNELLKQGNMFWNALHSERTAMLFAKENYYGQMQNVHGLLNQLSDPQALIASNPKKGEDVIVQCEKKLQSQQAKAESSRIEYEKSLAKLNNTIENFGTVYKPILNRVQEADES